MATTTEKMPLATLTAMVVGGMVGAGVFSIPRNFAMATGVYGALIAWTIAGFGMLMLAFGFQKLANRKPEPTPRYAYARAGSAYLDCLRLRYRPAPASATSHWC
jgi:arginine:ornithine antiporter/lysine permease